MGKTGKLKAGEKLAGGGGEGSRLSSPQSPPGLVSCYRFLDSADPNNSEPGTG